MRAGFTRDLKMWTCYEANGSKTEQGLGLKIVRKMRMQVLKSQK